MHSNPRKSNRKSNKKSNNTKLQKAVDSQTKAESRGQLISQIAEIMDYYSWPGHSNHYEALTNGS
jgi:hypothetical protein